MQLILLLSGLYVYQNHLSSGVIEEVEVDESVANATAVYITNRYYQRVITAPDAAVRVVERTGANWCHLITFTNYFQTS